MPKPQMFDTEMAMCACFIDLVKQKHPEWTVYPETAGFDILLVRDDDGFQIGIEAKLRLNLKVIAQALPCGSSFHWRDKGPDCLAVLVPSDANTSDGGKICSYLGVDVIRISRPFLSDEDRKAGMREEYIGKPHFYPDLPRAEQRYGGWNDRWVSERAELPDYVPDVPAGDKSPLQLTDWKIRAIKLLIVLEKRGYVTAEDFRHLEISPSRWIQGYPDMRWLRKGEFRGQWIAGPSTPDYKSTLPKNYAEIEADYDEWAPVDPGRTDLFEGGR